jgi:hypothetical protein
MLSAFYLEIPRTSCTRRNDCLLISALWDRLLARLESRQVYGLSQYAVRCSRKRRINDFEEIRAAKLWFKPGKDVLETTAVVATSSMCLLF